MSYRIKQEFDRPDLLKNELEIIYQEYIDFSEVLGYDVEWDVQGNGTALFSYSFRKNTSGDIVPILIFNDQTSYTADFQDYYIYVGVDTIDGINYDKWQKIEVQYDGKYYEFGFDSETKAFIYTNIVVEEGTPRNYLYIDSNLTLTGCITDTLYAGSQFNLYRIPEYDESIWPQPDAELISLLSFTTDPANNTLGLPYISDLSDINVSLEAWKDSFSDDGIYYLSITLVDTADTTWNMTSNFVDVSIESLPSNPSIEADLNLSDELILTGYINNIVVNYYRDWGYIWINDVQYDLSGSVNGLFDYVSDYSELDIDLKKVCSDFGITLTPGCSVKAEFDVYDNNYNTYELYSNSVVYTPIPSVTLFLSDDLILTGSVSSNGNEDYEIDLHIFKDNQDPSTINNNSMGDWYHYGSGYDNPDEDFECFNNLLTNGIDLKNLDSLFSKNYGGSLEIENGSTYTAAICFYQYSSSPTTTSIPNAVISNTVTYIVEDNFVAEYNGVKYETLAEAIDAANNNGGGIIIMLSDVTVSATLSIEKPIEIDGQGSYSINSTGGVLFSIATTDFTLNGIKEVNHTGTGHVILVSERKTEFHISVQNTVIRSSAHKAIAVWKSGDENSTLEFVNSTVSAPNMAVEINGDSVLKSFIIDNSTVISTNNANDMYTFYMNSIITSFEIKNKSVLYAAASTELEENAVIRSKWFSTNITVRDSVVTGNGNFFRFWQGTYNITLGNGAVFSNDTDRLKSLTDSKGNTWSAIDKLKAAIDGFEALNPNSAVDFKGLYLNGNDSTYKVVLNGNAEINHIHGVEIANTEKGSLYVYFGEDYTGKIATTNAALSQLRWNYFRFHDSLEAALADDYNYILIPKDITLSAGVTVSGTKQILKANIVDAQLAASTKVPMITYNGEGALFNLNEGASLTVKGVNVTANKYLNAALGRTFITYEESLANALNAEGWPTQYNEEKGYYEIGITVSFTETDSAEEKYFATLDAAITAANKSANGGTIKLLSDVTVSATLSIEKPIEIDGQGMYTINSAAGGLFVIKTTDFTLKGVKEVKYTGGGHVILVSERKTEFHISVQNTVIRSSAHKAIAVWKSGDENSTLEFVNSTVSAPNMAVEINGDSVLKSFIINNSTVISTNNANGIYTFYMNATITSFEIKNKSVLYAAASSELEENAVIRSKWFSTNITVRDSVVTGNGNFFRFWQGTYNITLGNGAVFSNDTDRLKSLTDSDGKTWSAIDKLQNAIAGFERLKPDSTRGFRGLFLNGNDSTYKIFLNGNAEINHIYGVDIVNSEKGSLYVYFGEDYTGKIATTNAAPSQLNRNQFEFHDTLEDAIVDGYERILIPKDINLNENDTPSFETMVITKNLTIDGNGHRITGKNAIQKDGNIGYNTMFDVSPNINFTLKNVTINYTANESASPGYSIGYIIHGYFTNVNIENSTLIGSKVMRNIHRDSTINILNSKLIGTRGPAISVKSSSSIVRTQKITLDGSIVTSMADYGCVYIIESNTQLILKNGAVIDPYSDLLEEHKEIGIGYQVPYGDCSVFISAANNSPDTQYNPTFILYDTSRIINGQKNNISNNYIGAIYAGTDNFDRTIDVRFGEDYVGPPFICNKIDIEAENYLLGYFLDQTPPFYDIETGEKLDFDSNVPGIFGDSVYVLIGNDLNIAETVNLDKNLTIQKATIVDTNGNTVEKEVTVSSSVSPAFTLTNPDRTIAINDIETDASNIIDGFANIAYKTGNTTIYQDLETALDKGFRIYALSDTKKEAAISAGYETKYNSDKKYYEIIRPLATYFEENETLNGLWNRLVYDTEYIIQAKLIEANNYNTGLTGIHEALIDYTNLNRANNEIDTPGEYMKGIAVCARKIYADDNNLIDYDYINGSDKLENIVAHLEGYDINIFEPTGNLILDNQLCLSGSIDVGYSDYVYSGYVVYKDGVALDPISDVTINAPEDITNIEEMWFDHYAINNYGPGKYYVELQLISAEQGKTVNISSNEVTIIANGNITFNDNYNVVYYTNLSPIWAINSIELLLDGEAIAEGLNNCAASGTIDISSYITKTGLYSIVITVDPEIAGNDILVQNSKEYTVSTGDEIYFPTGEPGAYTAGGTFSNREYTWDDMLNSSYGNASNIPYINTEEVNYVDIYTINHDIIVPNIIGDDEVSLVECNSKNVVLPENIQYVSGWTREPIGTIYIKNSTPPELDGTFDDGVELIVVPVGSSSAYKSASNWANYGDIIKEGII